MLKWETSGAVLVAVIVRQAKYRFGDPYEVRVPFAQIRPMYESDFLYAAASKGFVVTRNTFDDVRHFPTLDQAKLYVESLAELEKE